MHSIVFQNGKTIAFNSWCPHTVSQNSRSRKNSTFLFPSFLIFSFFFLSFLLHSTFSSIAFNLFLLLSFLLHSTFFSIARKPAVTPTSGVRSRNTWSKKHSCYTFAPNGHTEYSTVPRVQVQCRRAGPTLQTIACNGFFHCAQGSLGQGVSAWRGACPVQSTAEYPKTSKAPQSTAEHPKPHKAPQSTRSTAKHRRAPQSTAEHRRAPEAPRSTAKHRRAPQNTAKPREAPQSTAKHRKAPQSTAKPRRAPQSTAEPREAPQSTAKHRKAPQSTAKPREAPQSTAKPRKAPQSTTKHWGTAVGVGELRIYLWGGWVYLARTTESAHASRARFCTIYMSHPDFQNIPRWDHPRAAQDHARGFRTRARPVHTYVRIFLRCARNSPVIVTDLCYTILINTINNHYYLYLCVNSLLISH